MDVASGRIYVLAGEPNAKHIDPQYSADGKSLYYVSDRGGFTDIYRVVIETGETFRVTRAATGVSGVTATSPSILGARQRPTHVLGVRQGGLPYRCAARGARAGRAGRGR
jgi:hypothetical protein